MQIRSKSNLVTIFAAFLLLSVVNAAASGVSYEFTHLLGPSGSQGFVDGIGAAAKFWTPAYIAKDSHGDLYVSDGDKIRKVTPAGVVTTLQVTPRDVAEPALGQVMGLVFDKNDNLYLCDQYNFTVRKLSPDGTLSTIAGKNGEWGSLNGVGSAARFRNLVGIAIDSHGNLFVCDEGNNAIRKITPDGTVTAFAGVMNPDFGLGFADGTGPTARFNQPIDVAIDSSDNLYVAEWGNPLIRKVTPGAVVTTIAGFVLNYGYRDATGVDAMFGGKRYDFGTSGAYTGFGTTGIAVGKDGNVYVSDGGNNVIRKINSSKVVTTVAGVAGWPGYADGGRADARINNGGGLVDDGFGSIYFVSDRSIRKLSPDGVVTTVAGQAVPIPGDKDGPVSVALTNFPGGLARGADGTLYFTESESCVVRKMSPAGVVSTIAGEVGVKGTSDGKGAAAHFYNPWGIAVDSTGIIYVADTWNSSIRRIKLDGTVDTFAGLSGTTGSADGQGSAARFNAPGGIAVAPDDSLLVSDVNNHTIRKISKTGLVSTFAGIAGVAGASDGNGASATFGSPGAIAIGADGVAYVVDWHGDKTSLRTRSVTGVASTLPVRSLGNQTLGSLAIDSHGVLFGTLPNEHAIIRIRTDYEWEMIGGITYQANTGNSDGIGLAASFSIPSSLVVSPDGKLYILDFGVLRLGTPLQLIEFTQQPESQTIPPNSSFTLSTQVAGDGPLSYQWKKDGTDIPGATGLSYTIPSISKSDEGLYILSVTGPTGTSTSRFARLAVENPIQGKITNMSIRCSAGRSGSTLIVGFVTAGGGVPMLVRAAGPALAAFGVQGVMLDPELAVFDGQTPGVSNDDWGSSTDPTALSALFGSAGAFPFAEGSFDAAVAQTITGLRTVHISPAKASGPGVALVEAYDTDLNSVSRLTNVSARYYAGTGPDTLIAGFVVNGTAPKKLLIRGVGPGLAQFGIYNYLSNPSLALHSSINNSDTVVATNDNWYDEAGAGETFAKVGAFQLPSGSLDSAILVTLPAGTYTVHVNGVSGLTGEALIEVYEVP